MFVFLNSQQITNISKNIAIKKHLPINKYLYGCNIDHKSILLEST